MLSAYDQLQVVIVVLSLLSVWLLGSMTQGRRFTGACLGTATQPLWFIAGVATGNWSLLVLSPVFAFLYIRAARNYSKEPG